MYDQHSDLFAPVADAVEEAVLIAWDGCHKIYVALDAEQAKWFAENYDYVVKDTPEVLLDTLVKWYDESCALRFIQSVVTNDDDPNEGYVNLISQ